MWCEGLGETILSTAVAFAFFQMIRELCEEVGRIGRIAKPSDIVPLHCLLP